VEIRIVGTLREGAPQQTHVAFAAPLRPPALGAVASVIDAHPRQGLDAPAWLALEKYSDRRGELLERLKRAVDGGQSTFQTSPE